MIPQSRDEKDVLRELWLQKLEIAMKLIDELMCGQPYKIQRTLEDIGEVLTDLKDDVTQKSGATGRPFKREPREY